MSELDEIKDDVKAMRQEMLGFNGQPGLCENFQKLSEDYFKFKRVCFIIFGVLIGSGVLSISLLS